MRAWTQARSKVAINCYGLRSTGKAAHMSRLLKMTGTTSVWGRLSCNYSRETRK